MDDHTVDSTTNSSLPDGIPAGTTPTTKKVLRRGKLVATYDYKDAGGKVVYQVQRFEHPRGFLQRRPDPDRPGRWINNLDGVERVLYRLDELVAATDDVFVFVVEGEKDADNLRGLGLIATTNPGGAGRWFESFSPHFTGKTVVIIPDNDVAGRAHAQKVERSLSPHAEFVRIVELPGLPKKGDVSGWIERGGSEDQLYDLIEAKQAEAHPPAPEPPDPGPTSGTGPRPAVPKKTRSSGRRGPGGKHHDKASVLAAMGPSGLAQFARELGLKPIPFNEP